VNENIQYIRMFAQFPFSLRRFLRYRLTLDEARATIRRRMEQREANFLHSVERSIYGNPGSPYLPLLKMAGCEMGDVQRLVGQRGLENALRQLREAGVYVTFEEFKGRKPIERHGRVLPVAARDFDNPRTRHDLFMQTGGSTGAAINVGVDLDDIAAHAPQEMTAMAAHGLLDAPRARWSGPLPAGALRSIMKCIPYGHIPTFWFSPNGLTDSKHWVKYGLATYYILSWLRIFGQRVPWPRTVKVDDAITVARSTAQLLRAHGRCAINTTVSRALRVSLAAQDAGIDLTGASFFGTSEPATPAKVRQILASGAGFVSTYGMVEAHRIGIGCARSEMGDDVHLQKDAYAMFAHPYEVPGFGVKVPAFNLTSLLPTASKVLLNLQMDDYGILEERRCGCALEASGLTTHIRQIRSYSKLTGEGVTLIGDEVVRALEEVLPARFGGTPLDYQLVEQEDAAGFTRLYLRISPRLDIADEELVRRVVLQALSDSSSMADAARTVWQHTDTLQVERREPILTARGKHFPLRFLD
jgi:hypothetical protein